MKVSPLFWVVVQFTINADCEHANSPYAEEKDMEIGFEIECTYTAEDVIACIRNEIKPFAPFGLASLDVEVKVGNGEWLAIQLPKL